jgi:hypothetical protein
MPAAAGPTLLRFAVFLLLERGPNAGEGENRRCTVPAQPDKLDHDAYRVSQENAKRHKEAIAEIARKNEAVQRDAMKIRHEADRVKAEIRRNADL